LDGILGDGPTSTDKPHCHAESLGLIPLDDFRDSVVIALAPAPDESRVDIERFLHVRCPPPDLG
jgi:hypothetical protein